MATIYSAWDLLKADREKGRLVKENRAKDLVLLEDLCRSLALRSKSCSEACWTGSRGTDHSTYPNATSIEGKIPIYSGPDLLPRILESETERQTLMDEFHHVLLQGPGVIVIQQMMDPEIVRKANELNEQFSTDKKDALASRTMRLEEKHAIADAESYAEYYSNPIL